MRLRHTIGLIIVAAIGLVVTWTAQSQDSDGTVRHYLLQSSGNYGTTRGGVVPAMVLNFDQDPSGATITAEGSSAFVLTKVSDPERVTDATWRNGVTGSPGYAHKFDGDDAYSCADATCAANPSGSFSVIAVVTPISVTGTQYIVGKWIASDPNRSWALYLSSASAVFAISKDGTAGASLSSATRTGCAAIGRTSVIIGVYTYVADGTSVLDIYCDNLAAVQTTSAVGPAYDNNEDFVIGANGTPASFFTGNIHHIEYIPGKALSASEVSVWAKQFRGMMATTKNPMATTCTTCPGLTMAPPGSGVEPFIIRQPSGTSWVGSPATNQGGIYNCLAISNIAQRSAICETPDGSDHPTGWTTAESTSEVSCVESTTANGIASVEIIHNDAADVSSLTSACLTTGIAADLYVELYAKDSGGTAELAIDLLEYDAADCSGGVLDTDNLVAAADLTSSWAIYPTPASADGLQPAADWHADTSSYKVVFTETGTTTVYLDVPTVVASSSSTLGTFCSCTADTDATAVCNAQYVSITDNPMPLGGTWEISLDFYGNWAGNDGVGHYLTYIGTSANQWNVLKNTSNSLLCSFYDTGGTVRSASEAVNATDWPAATKHSIKCTRYMDGDVSGSLNGTGFGTQLTSGAAIQNAATTTLNFGWSTSGHRGVISNVVFRNRATQ